MIEKTVSIIKAKKQRADLAAVALVAEAADHAVRRLETLDLDHRPLAALVWPVEPFRHHPVGSGETGEPAFRLGEVTSCRSEKKAALALRLPGETLELAASLGQGTGEQHAPVGGDEQVEQDEPRRGFRGQFPDSAFGRMETHLQRVER